MGANMANRDFKEKPRVDILVGVIQCDGGGGQQPFNNMFELKKRILIVLELVALASGACWTELPQLRTGTFQPISSITSVSSNVTTFPVAFTSAIAPVAPLFWGLGLVAYDNYLTTEFSFNTTMDAVTASSISVTVKPKDSTYMLLLKLNYIVTSLLPTAVPHIELIHGCYKCLNLSQTVNATQSLLTRSESFNQTGFIPYTTSVKISTFLYSFNFSNSFGQLNYLQAATVYNPNNSYTITVTTKEYNTIDFVCVSVLAWKSADNLFGKGIAGFFQVGDLDPFNKTTLIYYYSSFDCSNLKFMGLSSLAHKMGGERKLITYPEPYSSFNASGSFDSNSDFLTATLNIFYVGSLICDPATSVIYVPWPSLSCQGACPPELTANVSNECMACSPSCLTCNTTNPNQCLSCSPTTNRNGSACACTGLYYSNSSDPASNCLLCSDYLLYCTSCTNSSICLGCEVGKFLVGSKCECRNNTTPTYFITNICLTYPGCVNATTVTNADYCSTCNTSANFQHPSASNLTCICAPGYTNVGHPLVCTPVCGDGTVNNEPCDDNNTVSGDGCSSTCQIELGWSCLVKSGTTGPSKCLPISGAAITYIYAERVVGTNTAMLYFSFSPPGTNMPSNAFVNTISTSAPATTITPTFDNANSRITLALVFSDNMEGNTYSFTFNFTSAQVYYSDPLTVQAVTQGVNEQLLFENYGILVKTLTYVVMGTGFLGLGLGVLSAGVGYKLMGLELLLPMQAAFFAEFGLINPPPYVSTLKGLKYSLGYNQLIPYKYEKFAGSNSKFAKYDFQIEMALNINIMAGVLMLFTVVLLILQVIYLYRYSRAAQEQRALAPPVEEEKKKGKGKKEEKVVFEVKEEGELGEALKSARENRNTFVNNIYFFISVMISQEALFCFVIQNSQFAISEFYLSEDINLMTGYLTLLLVVANLIFMLCQLTEKKDRRIITFHETRAIKYPIFLIISTLLMTLFIAFTFTFSFSAYIATALSAFPLIGLIYFRPYRHEETSLNAFSAFLNLAFPMVASSVYLANNIINLSEFGWLMSAVAVVAWQFATETVTIIRLIKMVPWRQLPLIEKCFKKKKKPEESLLDKNKVEIEISSMVKNSIKGETGKIVDWEEKNKKEYESIVSKPDNDDDAEISDHNEEEDELAQLKRRLKKEIMMKKAQ